MKIECLKHILRLLVVIHHCLNNTIVLLKFLKTKVSLYSDTDDIEEDMRELFWLLSDGNII